MKRVFLLLLLTCCLLIAPAAAAGGSGTASSPYIIETAAELQSIQNNLAAYYKLANDINLQSISFTPIGSQSTPFTGSFDGAGYTISNLVISSSTGPTGFFRCLGSGATVKNTIFQDCSVTATDSRCGVVIGLIIMSSSAHDTAVVSNVDCVRCSASSSGSSVGCLVGLITTSAVVEITDCDVSYCIAESYSGTDVGCLVGVCAYAPSTEITRCNVLYSHARSSGYYAACLVGLCYSASLVIDSSTAQNSIAESTSSTSVGCLVGECNGASSVNAFNCDVVNCLAKGTGYVGGLYGVNKGGSLEVSDCIVTGCTIVATGNYAGGVVGLIASGQLGIFSGCTVTDSTIIASGYAAGVCPAYS